MKIFITGASGFIGGAVANFLKNNHSIIALARSEIAAKKIVSLGVTPVLSDLKYVQSQHLAGCDVVIHCAAYAEEWGSKEQFYQANVEGTKTLLAAAKTAKVKRFIFIGTEAVLFHGQDMLNISETYPRSLHSPYLYSQTKAKAEELVLAANTTEFQSISLRPRMVWGPGDKSILPALLDMIKMDRFSWIGNGNYKTSTTHIGNLVHAIDLSLSKGIGGEAYFIANDETVIMKDFLSRYVRSQGLEVPNRSIPKSVARALAYLAETIWKVFRIRRKPPLVRFTIDIMSSHCTVLTGKAEKGLGYRPIISTEEGLKTMPRLSP